MQKTIDNTIALVVAYMQGSTDSWGILKMLSYYEAFADAVKAEDTAAVKEGAQEITAIYEAWWEEQIKKGV
jgi:hypothetical protein